MSHLNQVLEVMGLKSNKFIFWKNNFQARKPELQGQFQVQIQVQAQLRKMGSKPSQTKLEPKPKLKKFINESSLSLTLQAKPQLSLFASLNTTNAIHLWPSVW